MKLPIVYIIELSEKYSSILSNIAFNFANLNNLITFINLKNFKTLNIYVLFYKLLYDVDISSSVPPVNAAVNNKSYGNDATVSIQNHNFK